MFSWWICLRGWTPHRESDWRILSPRHSPVHDKSQVLSQFCMSLNTSCTLHSVCLCPLFIHSFSVGPGLTPKPIVSLLRSSGVIWTAGASVSAVSPHRHHPFLVEHHNNKSAPSWSSFPRPLLCLSPVVPALLPVVQTRAFRHSGSAYYNSCGRGSAPARCNRSRCATACPVNWPIRWTWAAHWRPPTSSSTWCCTALGGSAPVSPAGTRHVPAIRDRRGAGNMSRWCIFNGATLQYHHHWRHPT